MIKPPNAASVLDQLVTQTPIPLAQVNGASGIYALEDECGVVRYIGEPLAPFSIAYFSGTSLVTTTVTTIVPFSMPVGFGTLVVVT